VGKKPAVGRRASLQYGACPGPNADAGHNRWMMRRKEATSHLASRSVVVLNAVFSLASFQVLDFSHGRI
jgi:hypothetical protein